MSGLFVSVRLTVPEREIVRSYARSSGPGGQNVNKVATKVELRWSPGSSAVLRDHDRVWLLESLAGRLTRSGDLVVTSERFRERGRNETDARQRLAAILAAALRRPVVRRETAPTRASRRRRLDAKKHRSKLKSGRGRKSWDD